GKKDDSYIFTICNEKGEFSSQVLENGTKLFFTSNNNRNSIHYGMKKESLVVRFLRMELNYFLLQIIIEIQFTMVLA
ncbi:hypothetical protein DW723_17735, partial [Blautia obeum]